MSGEEGLVHSGAFSVGNSRIIATASFSVAIEEFELLC